jgi:hypothetical protein
MNKDMDNTDESIDSSQESPEIESPISEEPSSQVELIKQWRTALSCLMKDVKFSTRCIPEGEKLISVRESIEYLDKKNTLLDEDDDFQLSESGVSKYKAKHMQVFNYLSKLSKHAIPQIKPKFYFVDIKKHLEQQLLPSKWTHFLKHLLLIPVVCIVFVVIGALMVKQTQNNTVVNLLFFLCVMSQFSVIPELFKKVKKTVASPFKFKVSLLSIYLLSALKKLFWICLIPFLVIKRVHPYWIDDVIIVSLFIYTIATSSADTFIEPDSLSDSAKKEVENA